MVSVYRLVLVCFLYAVSGAWMAIFCNGPVASSDGQTWRVVIYVVQGTVGRMMELLLSNHVGVQCVVWITLLSISAANAVGKVHSHWLVYRSVIASATVAEQLPPCQNKAVSIIHQTK